MRRVLSYWKDNPLIPAREVENLPAMPVPSKKDRLLIIVPHPDDETLGVAGFIQRAVAKGASVHVVMATDGNRRGKQVRRKREVTAALRLCGLSDSAISFYDFPDGTLHEHAQALGEQLAVEVRTFIPTLLVVTDPMDIHRDHAVLGRIVEKIAEQGLLPLCRCFGTLIHYHRFPRPLGSRPASSIVPPGRLVELPGWRSFALMPEERVTKRKAILEYKSQLLTPFLRGLMFSFDRTNELFRELGKAR